jgi:hypothetical protein
LRVGRSTVAHGTYGHTDQNAQTDLYGDANTHNDTDPHRDAAANSYVDADAAGHQYADRVYGHPNPITHRYTPAAAHTGAADQYTQAHCQAEAKGNQYTQATATTN